MLPSPGVGDPGSLEAGFQGRRTLRGSIPRPCPQPEGLAKEPHLEAQPKWRPDPLTEGGGSQAPQPSFPSAGPPVSSQ